KANLIVEKALRKGRKTLSEYESKQVLAAYHIPITKEVLIKDKDRLDKAVQRIGFPLVMKGCSADIAHKTEKGLIHVDIRSVREAKKAYGEIMAGMKGFDGAVLVQEMIKGRRELVVGLTRDPQFGPCVMFGLGGIFTEILHDVSFRRAPLEIRDAQEMMRDIKGHKILDAVRGMEAADEKRLTDMLINVGRIGLDIPEVSEIDLNPVIISGSKPVVVDALIILKNPGSAKGLR
ncbi:MAG TPA: acetate--CoA ligase family protein, partial [Smithellaceae bacterium]|nr:acetate--CoA ligase family protein [Smithellaceae bacterium]